jgi:CheY-like chemotaxis protein
MNGRVLPETPVRQSGDSLVKDVDMLSAVRGGSFGARVDDRGAFVSDALLIEIIRVAPAALWVLFALFAYLTLRKAFLPQLSRLSTVKAPGIEMSFAERLLDEAEKQGAEQQGAEQQGAEEQGAPTSGPQNPGPQRPGHQPSDGETDRRATTPSQRRATISRLQHAAEFLQGGRILWVNDHPEWNSALISLFRQSGMTVTTARSTDEAMSLVNRESFDLVITDMHRETEQPAATAGRTLIAALAQGRRQIPVILFSERFDPHSGLPRGVFAYATITDSVVQYVIDVMERIRFGVSIRVPTPRR